MGTLRTSALRTPVLRTLALRTPALRTPALRTPVLRTLVLRTPVLRTHPPCGYSIFVLTPQRLLIWQVLAKALKALGLMSRNLPAVSASSGLVRETVSLGQGPIPGSNPPPDPHPPRWCQTKRIHQTVHVDRAPVVVAGIPRAPLHRSWRDSTAGACVSGPCARRHVEEAGASSFCARGGLLRDRRLPFRVPRAREGDHSLLDEPCGFGQALTELRIRPFRCSQGASTRTLSHAWTDPDCARLSCRRCWCSAACSRQLTRVGESTGGCSWCCLQRLTTPFCRCSSRWRQLSHTAPLHTAPLHTAPLHTAPSHPNPFPCDPTRSYPILPDLIRSDPIRSDPIRSDLILPDPIRSYPIRSDPTRSDPTRSDPIVPQPAEYVLSRSLVLLYSILVYAIISRRHGGSPRLNMLEQLCKPCAT